MHPGFRQTLSGSVSLSVLYISGIANAMFGTGVGWDRTHQRYHSGFRGGAQSRSVCQVKELSVCDKIKQTCQRLYSCRWTFPNHLVTESTKSKL